jgi:hypothetical protein
MPISKIKGGAINDDAISTAKIVDDAVTSSKIVDSYTTALQTNPEFSGTEAARMPNGTTAQRANAAAGDLRYNTTTNLMEYYNGSGWKSIDSPPLVESVSPSSIANSSSSVNITITGDFFTSGATVKAIGQDSSVVTASSVTFTNSTTLVANFNGTSFSDAQEDYSIEVTNVSGLIGKGTDLLAVNATPAWTVAAGSLGTFFDVNRTSISITTGATDDEGASLTYAVASGSLPSGLSISSSTGTITGTASAVGSDTTTSFTLSVTDGTNTTTRAYSILVKAPVITSYTSTGSGTFSVPSGVAAVDVLVVAGGGGGGDNQAAGGAGGLIYRPAFPVTPGGSVSYTIGGGGNGCQGNNATQQTTGQDSVFGTLTTKGGGAGGAEYGPGGANGSNGCGFSGGSGGGGGYPNGGYGSGIQPQQPGDSGTYGFGNHGGSGQGSSPYATGGGGGAGGAGGQAGGQTAGDGGIGRQYAISGSQVYYAGGGGGGTTNGPSSSTHRGTGGQGGGGTGGNQGTPNATAGTANRGGGGGSNGEALGQGSNPGGSGIVIVSY